MRTDRIAITVAAPAGSAPLGPPVETSVSFGRGQVRNTQGLAIISPRGRPVSAQMRPALHWPDGSVRWLEVIFEAADGPGEYLLTQGKTPGNGELLREQGESIIIATGELTIAVPRARNGLLESLAAPGPDGQMISLIKGQQAAELVMIRHDGKVFRASLAGETRRVIIEERGPLRASLRIEGKCRAEDGEALFDYIVRWRAYRGRPEAFLSITWVNATPHAGEQIRDIRVIFPYQFQPDRLVFGCETGVYDGPFLRNWPVYILQEDHNCYWARTLNPEGRWQNLSSGGCNGEHFPGWLYLTQQAEKISLGVFLPNFWQEYPNEVYVRDGELSIGLWPERAADHLMSKPLLSSNPEGNAPYRHTRYRPIMPHPYLAFFDARTKCLDVPQGVAKTQEILLSPWAGDGEAPTFERKWWAGALKPVRGFVDPLQVARSRACGPLWPRDAKHFPEAERVFDECFGWFDRHVDLFRCYGKFDFGDFRYFVPSTTYMCHPGTKWGHMGEMAREGYWHNNERDVLRGLLLYYLRTGNPRAWELCQATARHLLDVDIRHFPHWGMYTHGYGHCYAAEGKGGEPDHSWLLGLLEWAGVSGDPLVWEWMLNCGDYLAGLTWDFSKTDTRTTSMQLHMMTQFYRYTGKEKYLQAASGPAEALLKKQKPDGAWPAYLGRAEEGETGFVEHAVMAPADYYAVTGDERFLEPLKKALQWVFSNQARPFDVAEDPLTMYALALVGERTDEPAYAEMVREAFRSLDKRQNRSPDAIGRGDPWASWEVNNAEFSQQTGRPPQFYGQTRPLVPATILAYAPASIWFVAHKEKLALPGKIARTTHSR